MISKKAAAFLGTPPGEGGGGRGKGERRGGGSPKLHATGAKRNGGSLGIPLRSGAERRTLAAVGGSSPLATLPRRGASAQPHRPRPRQARAHRRPRAPLGYSTKESFA